MMRFLVCLFVLLSFANSDDRFLCEPGEGADLQTVSLHRQDYCKAVGCLTSLDRNHANRRREAHFLHIVPDARGQTINFTIQGTVHSKHIPIVVALSGGGHNVTWRIKTVGWPRDSTSKLTLLIPPFHRYEWTEMDHEWKIRHRTSHDIGFKDSDQIAEVFAGHTGSTANPTPPVLTSQLQFEEVPQAITLNAGSNDDETVEYCPEGQVEFHNESRVTALCAVEEKFVDGCTSLNLVLQTEEDRLIYVLEATAAAAQRKPIHITINSSPLNVPLKYLDLYLVASDAQSTADLEWIIDASVLKIRMTSVHYVGKATVVNYLEQINTINLDEMARNWQELLKDYGEKASMFYVRLGEEDVDVELDLTPVRMINASLLSEKLEREMQVKCTKDELVVTVWKRSVAEVNFELLTWEDRDCDGITVDAEKYVLTSVNFECGTQTQLIEPRHILTNKIVFRPPADKASDFHRVFDLEDKGSITIDVRCEHIEQKKALPSELTSLPRSSHSLFEFNAYTDLTFMTPAAYPFHVFPFSKAHAQINFRTQHARVGLFVSRCWLTESRNSIDHPTNIVQYGCPIKDVSDVWQHENAVRLKFLLPSSNPNATIFFLHCFVDLCDKESNTFGAHVVHSCLDLNEICREDDKTKLTELSASNFSNVVSAGPFIVSGKYLVGLRTGSGESKTRIETHLVGLSTEKVVAFCFGFFAIGVVFAGIICCIRNHYSSGRGSSRGSSSKSLRARQDTVTTDGSSTPLSKPPNV